MMKRVASRRPSDILRFTFLSRPPSPQIPRLFMPVCVINDNNLNILNMWFCNKYLGCLGVERRKASWNPVWVLGGGLAPARQGFTVGHIKYSQNRTKRYYLLLNLDF